MIFRLSISEWEQNIYWKTGAIFFFFISICIGFELEQFYSNLTLCCHWLSCWPCSPQYSVIHSSLQCWLWASFDINQPEMSEKINNLRWSFSRLQLELKSDLMMDEDVLGGMPDCNSGAAVPAAAAPKVYWHQACCLQLCTSNQLPGGEGGHQCFSSCAMPCQPEQRYKLLCVQSPKH